MQKVLVLDANQRSALAIIRSLGRRGAHVIAADHMPHTLGGASRYASESILYSNPARHPHAFVEEILSIVRRLGVGVVIPATDLTTMLLAPQPVSCQLKGLACAPAHSYETLTDKRSLLDLARTLGIAVPETVVAQTWAAVEAAAHVLGYPLVLKPSRSRYVKGDRVIFTSVLIVNSASELEGAQSHLTWLTDIPCLVQKFIPGYGAGIFTVYGSGGPVAWFSHRRIREKPPSGGVSVLSESVSVDSSMQIAAAHILSAVNWLGVAMVEFRVSTAGTPYLMEINGRFWGSLQLAVDCGIDFPWLTHQLFSGASVQPNDTYAVGRRLRWLLGDVDNLLIQLRSGRTGVPAKAAAFAQFLRTFADLHSRQEIMRRGDLRPACRELRSWIGALRP